MIINLAYFMPIFAFLLVFVVVYAFLAKTKLLGKSAFINIFVSFIAAIIFVASPAATEFTTVAFAWLAVFIVSLVFILLILAFTGGKLEDIVKSPALAKVVIIVLIVIFLAAGIKVFGPAIKPYLPGQPETGGAETLLEAKHLILHPAVLGTLLLLAIAAIVSYVLTKK